MILRKKPKRKPCACGGLALLGRRKCYQCILDERRKKAEGKRLSKLKKKARHENSIAGKKELMKKAWKLQSRAVRMAAADENGMVTCYTCEKKYHWKECQLGHYIHDKLDFDLARNLRIQCSVCNGYFYGSKNLAIYGIKLAEELGVEGMKRLRLDANTFGNGYSIAQLKEIIAKYS